VKGVEVLTKKDIGKHKWNIHHVFSQKLYPGLVSDPNNIVELVLKKEHRGYHDLYFCQTPEYITIKIRNTYPADIALKNVIYLNDKFWNNLYEVRADEDKKVIIKPLFEFVYGLGLEPIAIIRKEPCFEPLQLKKLELASLQT
jgi:hypothetical protein